MTVIAVCGAQYGSEGKGLVVDSLAPDYGVHVRAGAANAGHTIWVNGEKFTMQQLPCAAYSNPQADVCLGPGALISPDILLREVAQNVAWRQDNDHPPLRLRIDFRAHIITPEHLERERLSDLGDRIGSTSVRANEGIGEAQAARVQREATVMTARDWPDMPREADLEDLVRWLPLQADRGILLEGTQGAGLSNVTGQFPYVTSRDTTASGLAMDCGIGPRMLDEVVIVARTFPIRVSGTSGPFWPGSRETSWEELGLAEEKTTVTGLVRRVATFSLDQVDYAAKLNSATRVAITFGDYIDPTLADMKPGPHPMIASELRSSALWPLVEAIETKTGLPVSWVGAGPDLLLARESDRELHRRRDLEASMLRLRVPLEPDVAGTPGLEVEQPDTAHLRTLGLAAAGTH